MNSLHQYMTNFIKVFVLFCLVFSIGCTRRDSESKGASPRPDVVAQTTVLATIADDERPHTPDVGSGHQGSPAAEQDRDLYYIDFNPSGTGVAYIANVGSGVCVVHNGKRGPVYAGASIAALKVSPDGKRLAYGVVRNKKWLVVVDGKEFGPYDEIGPPVFSPDSKNLAFEARRGDTWQVVAEEQESAPVTSYYSVPQFSGDSNKILLFENSANDNIKKVVICSLKLRPLATIIAAAVPFVVSKDQNRIAYVIDEKGKQRVQVLNLLSARVESTGPEFNEVRQLAMNPDGSAISYVALKNEKKILVYNEKEAELPAGSTPYPPVIRQTMQGVGIVIAGKNGAYVHHAFYQPTSAIKTYKEAADLVFSQIGQNWAHGAIKDEKFIAVVNGVEGPSFDRVFEPEFSPDGKFLVYRVRLNGRRFVVVADEKGRVVHQYPSYERIFKPEFTADGKAVAYGVKDGNKLIWKVELL